jgi:hypothetical protein
MKSVYTTIPAVLCEYAVVNRKISHLKLYVYLKHISSGHIRFESRLYAVWATDLQVSTRTVTNGIEWLKKNKWITVNNKSCSLRIIGYGQLCRKLKLNNSKAVKYDEDDFSKFRGFCCGAIITYYMRRKIFSDRKSKWPGPQMDGSSTSHSRGPKGYYNLPVRYLSKCLGVSAATANKYKLAAIEAGYIIIKRNIKALCDNSGKKITKENFVCFAAYDSSLCGRLRQGKKYLKAIQADFIHSGIQMKSKRNKHGEKK